ncbi:flavin monoamine oxidase family protein [Embleya scabrispora]|uniref:flavin monoamine oxidase family protein n=1 Tax=Embleya scabrispora TaxID=159449 RepID=UPI00037443D4|nr:NAD(P)/FAD-dependent oxidoreductase [Embleya scabrispora]MYS80831.1 NAD(P)-binding protein [Streptomyces sp. SID5474]
MPKEPSGPRTSPARTVDRAGLPAPLRAVFATHAEARRRGLPVAEVAGEQAEAVRLERARRAEEREAAAGPSRRRLLGGAGAFAVAAAALPGGLLAPSRASAATSSGAPRIVVVGAGLAGLRCAHRLWTGRTPVAATVYEAADTHLGGRCRSLRGYFAGGQVHEHGGAFISSTDTAILALSRRLGLNKEVAAGGALATGDYKAWIDGAGYDGAVQQDDWVAHAYSAFSASYAAAGTPRYNNSTAEARRLDRMSALDYLAEIGLPASSRLGQLIQSLQLQSGGEPGDCSAMGLIGFLGSSEVFGGGGFDEKYHLVGGNDQLVSGMVAELPTGAVKPGHRLVALRQNATGSYTCTFDHAGSTVSVTADHVVLALPFSTLRDVDLSGASLSALKLKAIREQGMGQNAKIVTQLTRKTWPAVGGNGISNTGPNGYQTAWDGSVHLGENGAPALLVNFPGGNVARNTLTGAAHGPAPAADVQWFHGQIEHLFPGTTAAYNGKAYEDHWSLDPWSLGAYHYYRVGQYTSIAGYEGVQEGRIHFAGEHTDVDNSTLNAAVASGERAADEIACQI